MRELVCNSLSAPAWRKGEHIRFYVPAPEPDELIGFYTLIQLAGLPSYELENIPDVAHVLRILTETEAD